MENRTFVKYIILCLLICTLLLLPNREPSFKVLANIYSDATYCFYLDNRDFSVNDFETIVMGDGAIIRCETDRISDVKNRLHGIKGESMSFAGGHDDILNIINRLRVNVVISENVDGIYSVYGYTRSIENFVTVNGKRVNIQIAFTGGLLTVGTPLILGSY